ARTATWHRRGDQTGEPHAAAIDLVAAAVIRAQQLARYLRDAVHRGGVQRDVVGCRIRQWTARRRAEHRDARREDQPLHLRAAARFEHVPRAALVDVVGEAGV